MVKKSIIKGSCFGLTSGIITTLGLMVGLYSGTKSQMVVIGGIITIAIADAFSDALGIHISEESEKKNTINQIWAATLFTFISKFFFAMFFVMPVLLFDLKNAIAISIGFGLVVLGAVSYYIAKEQQSKPWKAILEHLFIALVVIIATYYVGLFVNSYFV